MSKTHPSTQTTREAIQQYELLILKGERITLKGTKESKAQHAREIIRYAISEMLGWSGEDARDHLTLDILKQMKLDKLFNYLTFPPDIDRNEDMSYIAYIAFPEIGFDYAQQALEHYRRVLSGEYSTFKRNFFKGPKGYQKMAVLLREFIANNIPAASSEELYRQFAATKEITKQLRKAKLHNCITRLYKTPLDCLHCSLNEEDKDEFLYNFYTYQAAFKAYLSDLGAENGLTGKMIRHQKIRKLPRSGKSSANGGTS